MFTAIAISVGVFGGVVALVGLYLLARTAALKSGERPAVCFVRVLAFLALVHGLGLVLVSACVLVAVPALVAPLPPDDHRWIVRFMVAGVVFVLSAGVVLRWTGWFPTRLKQVR
jgi:hypothetical protein